MSACSVSGCSGTWYARTFCHKHYARWNRHGDPLVLRPNLEFSRAVWWRISEEPISGCWLWTGAMNSTGYGVASVNGKRTGAHRAVYTLLRGEIGAGLTIDHLCRVPSCVNPWHMEAVPQGVNTLRGNACSGVNSRKTHCKRGHPFDSENTYRTRSGGRCCRRCHRAHKERLRRERPARERYAPRR
jgi:hypothetical protein